MNKSLLISSCLSVVVATATGCNSNSSNDGTSNSVSTTTPTTETTTPTTDNTTTTPVATTTTTAGVACDYNYSGFNSDKSVNLTSSAAWSCNTTSRYLTANGIPDHEVGTFPNVNNPNTISATTITQTYSLTPAVVSTTGSMATVVGFALNGVKFDPGTGGTCNDTGASCSLGGNVGAWRIEALGQSSFNFGTDENNAHVQPTGEYHYHGMPEKFMAKLNKGAAMTLVGWAADGFPIYARYGYMTAMDATSAIKVLKGSYKVKTTPDASRPATSLYAMGAFKQDYEYVAGLGDLDECNGRTGVTPEFPKGIYHYVITDTYPFIGRCLKGTSAAAGGGMPPMDAPPTDGSLPPPMDGTTPPPPAA
ncbi:MAG: YHYH protein [Moraxellaceae bacterium]|nr:YHYH protein [Moraxellaceae bacterium]